MKNRVFIAGVSAFLLLAGEAFPHCQMPCGIYHDDMVFDEIDQYVETMYKGISVMNNSAFANAKDRNEFMRWVIEKEKLSNIVADYITLYFLQQKIKPGEPETAKRLASAHTLLFTLVAIKQNSSLDFVKTFAKEWEQFKLMFHTERYEEEMEKIKVRKIEEEAKGKGDGQIGMADDADDTDEEEHEFYHSHGYEHTHPVHSHDR